MASKWPFMAKIPADAKIRFLESEPLDFPPPPGFLPQALEQCPLDHAPQPGRIPVEIKSINGVETKPRSTYMFLRPVTLDKITKAIREAQGAETK